MINLDVFFHMPLGSDMFQRQFSWCFSSYDWKDTPGIQGYRLSSCWCFWIKNLLNVNQEWERSVIRHLEYDILCPAEKFHATLWNIFAGRKCSITNQFPSTKFRIRPSKQPFYARTYSLETSRVKAPDWIHNPWSWFCTGIIARWHGKPHFLYHGGRQPTPPGPHTLQK